MLPWHIPMAVAIDTPVDLEIKKLINMLLVK